MCSCIFKNNLASSNTWRKKFEAGGWNGLDLSTVNKFLHSRRLLTITQWCFVDNNGLHVRMASGGKQDSRRLEDSTMEVIRVYFVKHKSVFVPIYESQAVKVDSSAITFIFNFNLNDKKIIYIYHLTDCWEVICFIFVEPGRSVPVLHMYGEVEGCSLVSTLFQTLLFSMY